VICGLLVSTLLSLIFVPSFFTIMEGLSKFFGRLLGRFIGPKEADNPHISSRLDQSAARIREATK
jgi:HAE1 family hydrophobic/amphiphilic exporter-1